jgi:hypothetical protein
MFSIKRVGTLPGQPRLVAAEMLTPKAFESLALELGTKPMKARKVGFVSARIAKKREEIETLWNGKETKAIAAPGDRIVTNMSGDRKILRDADSNANTYVISAAKFPKLYARDKGKTEFGEIFHARGAVQALFLPGGFEIMAPWGEIQRAHSGYILLNGDEVYGNNKDTFDTTYVVAVETANTRNH